MRPFVGTTLVRTEKEYLRLTCNDEDHGTPGPLFFSRRPSPPRSKPPLLYGEKEGVSLYTAAPLIAGEIENNNGRKKRAARVRRGGKECRRKKNVRVRTF